MARATTSANTFRSRVLGIALAALLVPVAGWADTIPIPLTSGTLTLTDIGFNGQWNHQVLNAVGPDLALNLITGLGALGPNRCEPCFPGTTIFTGGDNSTTVAGTATFHGTTYGVFQSSLEVIGGSFTTPPLISSSFFAVVPFSLGVQVGLFGANPNTRIDAFGSGQAEFVYDHHDVPGQPDGWRLISGVYNTGPRSGASGHPRPALAFHGAAHAGDVP